MFTNKQCTNCPGATDHDTAHCPLRVINYGALDPEQRLALARGERAEGAQGERETFEAAYSSLDLSMGSDAWGRPAYRHSHVDALWEGWQARAALAQPSTAPKLELEGPEDDYAPPEILASKMIDTWCATHGKQIPWEKAVHITAIITNQSDEERDRLLSMGDEPTPVTQAGQAPECPDRGPWRPISNGRRTVVASDDFTHDVELVVTGDFADGDKHRYAEQLAAWMNAAAPAQGRE